MVCSRPGSVPGGTGKGVSSLSPSPPKLEQVTTNRLEIAENFRKLADRVDTVLDLAKTRVGSEQFQQQRQLAELERILLGCRETFLEHAGEHRLAGWSFFEDRQERWGDYLRVTGLVAVFGNPLVGLRDEDRVDVAHEEVGDSFRT